MKKSILFVIPSLIGGGAEKSVANLSLYLSEFFSVHILTLYDTEEKYRFNGTYHNINRKTSKNLIIKIFYYLKYFFEVKNLKKKLDVKCSISFLPQADIINYFSSAGEKRIISVRNNLSSAEYMRGIIKLLHHYVVRRADYVISITKGVENDLIKNYNLSKNKIKTIYNPAMIVEFGNSHNLDIIGSKYILTMGRLTHQKGHWHLIRAFTEVHKKFPDLKLIIIGIGPLYEYLNSLIKELDLTDTIILKGFVNNPYDYIKDANLFVFPSLYEGLGNSLLEVMNLEIPIISSDCLYGPREILDPKFDVNEPLIKNIKYNSECAVLVPVCDGIHYSAFDELTEEEKKLSEAIINTLKNKNLKDRIVKNAKNRVLDFRIEIIGNEWIKVINQLLWKRNYI